MASNVILKVLRLKDEVSGPLAGVAKAAGAASGGLDGVGDAAEEAAGGLGAAAGAAGEASGGLGGLAGAAGEAAGGLGAAGGAADDAADDLGDLAGSTKEAGGGLLKSAKKMAVFAAAAMAAVQTIKALTQGLADSRNELADTATRTGLTVKTLAGLRLAAEGSGQQLSSLASGLQQMPKRMADVARGTGEALIAFKALGVSATDDITGKLRPADDVLNELLGKLNEMPEGAEKAAMATQAFGESGGALMQALSGSELEDFTALATQYGVSIAPEAMKQSGAWERQVANLGLAFDGFKDKMSSALSGTDGVSGLIGAASSAMVYMGSVLSQLRSVMGQTFGEMLKPLVAMKLALEGDTAAALKLIEGLDFGKISGLDQVMSLPDVLSKAAEEVAEFNRLAAATITPSGAAGGPSGGGGGGAPAAAAAAAAAAEAGGAAPAPIVDELVDQSGQLQEAFRALLEMMSDTSDTAKNAAETFAVPLKLSEKLAETQAEAQANWNTLAETAFDLGLAFDDAFISMSETAQAEIDAIGVAFKQAQKIEKSERAGAAAGTAGDIIGAVSDPTAALSAAGPWGMVIAGVMSIGEDFKEFFTGVFDGLLATVAGILEDLPEVLFEIIPGFITGLIGTLIPSLFKMIPALISGIFTKLPEALIKGFKKAFQDIWQGIKDFFSNIFKLGKEGKNTGQKIGNTITDIFTFGQGRKVHEFHSGGFVPRDGQFLLKQGERVVPPTGADTQTAGRGLAAFSGGGANVTINTSVVDSNAIDALGRELDRHFGSFGRSSLPVFGS